MRRWVAAGPVLALAALAVASSAALWRPIGVFAFPSLHFMAHPGFVMGAWLVVATAAWAALRGRVALLTASFATPVGVFLGVATSGPWVFPAARVTLWGASLALAALWLIVGWRWFFGQAGPRALSGLLLGGLAGLMLVLAERPPPAATRPVGGSLPPVGDVDEALRLPCGTATVVLRPLLTFESTSRDGFWPGFSQADALQGPPPLLGAARRAALTHSPSSIEAVTLVPQEVASHLNRFTDLELEGVTAPAIRFGGTSRTFAFEPFDYPHGRPAHFAFFSGSRLVVARGSDAEKGPFIHLADGEPPQGQLRFALFDGPSLLCTLTFLDFATQADVTSESPTAGERVPPNVIQFGLIGRPPRPFVHLSLAETGVGAGLETIRHAAGTYRNRVLLSAP